MSWDEFMRAYDARLELRLEEMEDLMKPDSEKDPAALLSHKVGDRLGALLGVDVDKVRELARWFWQEGMPYCDGCDTCDDNFNGDWQAWLGLSDGNET